ncbi:hypothetical protein CBL_13060 [Carabus blaptoides fortunei]
MPKATKDPLVFEAEKNLYCIVFEEARSIVLLLACIEKVPSSSNWLKERLNESWLVVDQFGEWRNHNRIRTTEDGGRTNTFVVWRQHSRRRCVTGHTAKACSTIPAQTPDPVRKGG